MNRFHLVRLFTVSIVGQLKSFKTRKCSVQHYTWNRSGLGERSMERRWCSSRKRTFITEQLLRISSAPLLLFRENGKTGLKHGLHGLLV